MFSAKAGLVHASQNLHVNIFMYTPPGCLNYMLVVRSTRSFCNTQRGLACLIWDGVRSPVCSALCYRAWPPWCSQRLEKEGTGGEMDKSPM